MAGIRAENRSAPTPSRGDREPTLRGLDAVGRARFVRAMFDAAGSVVSAERLEARAAERLGVAVTDVRAARALELPPELDAVPPREFGAVMRACFDRLDAAGRGAFARGYADTASPALAGEEIERRFCERYGVSAGEFRTLLAV